MKTISVPTSQDAAQRLDMDEAREGDLVEEILDDDDFERIFASGWVDDVNAELDALIDDYEWEVIKGSDALARIEDISMRYKAMTGDEVFSRIAGLARKGKEFGTEMNFFF